MFGMTRGEKSGTPADIAAERAAIEAEIEGSTLLTAYAETVAAAADTVAHRWLEDRQWRSLTYRQVYDQVRDLAVGLGMLGFQPGEFAVIWSRNRSEATVADYAVMHAGGVPVFIYNTVSAEQAAYIVGHCEATVAIVEREFLPKLSSVRDELPKLRQIILIDDEAENAIGWPQLLALGHAEAERSPDLFERTWRQVTPDDLATLIYTSGTTGQPKAVMLTHRNIRYQQRAVLRLLLAELLAL
jgi:long-chain acyl-CoA synthetase